jgi:hypothetical protein
MAGYTKTYTLDFTSSGDTVYTGCDKLEDNVDSLIGWVNDLKDNYASASAPTSPAPDEGQLWWDSTNDGLYVYNGSAWLGPITDTYKVKADSSDSTEGYLNAKVQHSIAVNETNHKLQLSGDSTSPGNSYVYGTSAVGAKGWLAVSTLPTLLAGVSSNDTTPGYLNGKLVAGANISLTEGSDGGDETLTAAVALDDATAGNYVEGGPALLNWKQVGIADYTKVATIVVRRAGTYRFVFNLFTSYYPGITAYGKIYRNGEAVGVEKTRSTTSGTWQTDDIAGWSVGDTAELYIMTNNSNYFARAEFFCACVATPLISAPLYTDLILSN